MACLMMITAGCRGRGCVVGALGASAWRCGLRLVVFILLTVVVSTAFGGVSPAPAANCPDAGSANGSVYLLNAMYSPTDYMANHAQALWLGIDCALYHANYTAAGGRPIKIIEPDPSVNRSDIVAVVKKALENCKPLLGVIGPYSDAHLAAVLSDPIIKSSGVMFLAPFTGSSAVRQWNEQVYFTRADPRTELAVILNHALYVLGARRTAFMYLTGTQFGEWEYEAVRELLHSFSLNPPAVYAAPFSRTDSAVNRTAFDAMADTHPQVIIVWGAPGQQVAAFLQAVLTDPRTSSAYIMTCFPLQQLVFQVYYNLAMNGKLRPGNDQIMASATSLPVIDFSTEHMRAFRAEMGEYMAKTGRVNASLWADEARAVQTHGTGEYWDLSVNASVSTFLNEHPSTAQVMVAGWLPGKLIMQTLDQSTWITNRTTYRTGLFDQARYVIGKDFVLGDYGGPCTSFAQFLGATCLCNQGGKTAGLQTLADATWELLGLYTFTKPKCYMETIDVLRPVGVLTLNFMDIPRLQRAAHEMDIMLSDIIGPAFFDFATCSHAVLEVTQDTSQAALDREVSNYLVDVITGPFLQNDDVNGALVVSPVFPRPNLLVPKRNYLFLTPTLEQEMYLLYTSMAAVTALTSISADVHLVLHGYSGEEVAKITELAKKTAATFDLPDPSTASVRSGTSLGTSLEASRINLVLGLMDDDVPVLARFLSSHPSAIVVLSFCDLGLNYEGLVDAFVEMPASVQARLITFSNLPLWSDTSDAAHAASPLLEMFHELYPDSTTHTPSMLHVMLCLGLINVLRLTTSGVVNGSTLLDSAYRSGIINVYSVSLGNFQWGCTETTSGDVCVYQNYGASDIAILSMQRMLDPTVPQVSSPITPSMEYRPRTKSGSLTPAERNGIIAGATLFAVALGAACVLMVYCCADSRDNDTAPKDSDAPVTLVFTDIESSTALWAGLPQLMADAIAVHHAVIRQVIRECKCYEVKTIGDSFMIACKDAHVAVLLACEIQAKLLRYDWGTVSIDGAYRDFELARVETVDDYVPPTAQLGDEEYAALWRGLRVRMGIHTGLCDIRYDEVTKGYDYYGDTPNMAARTEAVANGGQVVATESTWWALSDDERASIAHTAMGPQGLRGVPFAVELFQLDAVPGRRHAALRTEIDAVLPDEAATETGSSAAGALLSSVDTMTGAAANVAFVLSSCFAPYPVAQRVRELQSLLTKWSVGAPPRSRHVSEEDYCRGLVNRLATRIATVSQVRQQVESDGVSAPADVPQLGPGGASNPLAGASGRISDDVTPRQSLMTALPRVVERSAMRESSVLRSSVLRRSPLSTGPSSRGESGDMDTAGCSDDAAVPFNCQPWRRVSEERSPRGGSAIMSDDVVVVRMPENLRYLHTSKVPDARGEKVTGDAPPAVRGACPPPVYGL